ncbi:hypothetical protein ACWN6Y_01785 [Vagococcus teuberi]
MINRSFSNEYELTYSELVRRLRKSSTDKVFFWSLWGLDDVCGISATYLG